MLSVFFHIFSDNMMEDMDVDLEKEFLHDLKDLKILVNDKDMLDQHKRHAASLYRSSCVMLRTHTISNIYLLSANIVVWCVHSLEGKLKSLVRWRPVLR